MIAQPTKCPHLKGSGNRHKIGENGMIVQPTECPQLKGSTNN